jgi:hypothetical protein
VLKKRAEVGLTSIRNRETLRRNNDNWKLP